MPSYQNIDVVFAELGKKLYFEVYTKLQKKDAKVISSKENMEGSFYTTTGI